MGAQIPGSPMKRLLPLLLVIPVLFAVLLFQASVVDTTPEETPLGQPGRTSPSEPGGDEGKAAA